MRLSHTFIYLAIFSAAFLAVRAVRRNSPAARDAVFTDKATSAKIPTAPSGRPKESALVASFEIEEWFAARLRECRSKEREIASGSFSSESAAAALTKLLLAPKVYHRGALSHWRDEAVARSGYSESVAALAECRTRSNAVVRCFEETLTKWIDNDYEKAAEWINSSNNIGDGGILRCLLNSRNGWRTVAEQLKVMDLTRRDLSFVSATARQFFAADPDGFNLWVTALPTEAARESAKAAITSSNERTNQFKAHSP